MSDNHVVLCHLPPSPPPESRQRDICNIIIVIIIIIIIIIMIPPHEPTRRRHSCVRYKVIHRSTLIGWDILQVKTLWKHVIHSATLLDISVFSMNFQHHYLF